MTDFRALCAELVELDPFKPGCAYADWGNRWRAAINRAKAALAQPKPKRPSDGELTLTYARAVAAAVDGKRCPFSVEDAEAVQLAGLRAVLDRWGGSLSNAQNQGVPQ